MKQLSNVSAQSVKGGVSDSVYMISMKRAGGKKGGNMTIAVPVSQAGGYSHAQLQQVADIFSANLVTGKK